MFSLNSILLHPLFLCHLEQTCAFSNRPLQVKQQRIIFVSLDFYILVCNSRNSITREHNATMHDLSEIKYQHSTPMHGLWRYLMRDI